MYRSKSIQGALKKKLHVALDNHVFAGDFRQSWSDAEMLDVFQKAGVQELAVGDAELQRASLTYAHGRQSNKRSWFNSCRNSITVNEMPITDAEARDMYCE